MRYSDENPYNLTSEELEKVGLRKERFERKVREAGMTDEEIRARAQKLITGVTQYDADLKAARVAGWTESMRDQQDRFREDIGVPIPEDAFKDVPPITKRTPQERVESLTKRLVKGFKEGTMEGAVVEGLLAELQTELFAMTGYRLGEQVAVDDIRRLAAFFLEQAEAKSKRKGS